MNLCLSVVDIACHRFTWPKRPSAMWIYACQWLTLLVIDSPGQNGQVQCESMFVRGWHCLSSIHLAKTVKCNMNLCLSVVDIACHWFTRPKRLCLSRLINDSLGTKGNGNLNLFLSLILTWHSCQVTWPKPVIYIYIYIYIYYIYIYIYIYGSVRACVCVCICVCLCVGK